ncbi:MAG TPA: M28 family peptidase, partial [Baekduia sp.]|nr:M28 family peptidase [Baekduia sp.]
LAAGRAPCLVRAAVCLAALAAWEVDASGRARALRRLLPRGEGANVVARVPARGTAHGTLVVVAHHDAARTGLMWHPSLTQAGARRHLQRHSVDPFAAPVGVGLAAAALGLRAGRVVLAAALALQLDLFRGRTVPGASDNATGVAVALDLARKPLEHLDLVVVLPGGEEAGMEGFAAALSRLDLDPARTLVLGLDTLGAGTPIVLEAEGALLRHRYRAGDLALADEGARLAGEPAPERWRIGGWTDPLLALRAGLPTISLLSMGPGYFPHYHHPTDVPEHVDWAAVGRCARIARGIAAAHARRVEDPLHPRVAGHVRRR